jgi:hypothetical protein
VMKCLLYATYSAIGMLGVAVILAILRYLLAPLWWLIESYWDWCSENIGDEFVGMLVAVIPVLMALAFLIILIGCMLGIK